MIIMDFIKGKPLQHIMITMSPQQSDSIKEQLKAQVNQLRQIPAPSYYGSIGRRPLLDTYTGRRFGPFDDISDMISESFDMALRHRSGQRFVKIKGFFSMIFESVSTALGHAYPLFTHGDLHEENIIIQPDGTPCIIDYEVAGFYPSYHERLSAEPLACWFNFLDEFPQELAIDINAHGAWHKATRDSEAESKNGSASEALDSDSKSP
ncbi:hypothetical protein F4782DRAFT_550212 [Xylaria castorea]|nr:hypothetical protein F4782DRAFT_550212 [Xylaria castorea]